MNFDAVVIGGGVVGSSCAYQLRRTGLSVLLVDRDDIGAASMAGAGIVQALVAAEKSEQWHTLAFAAAAHYWELKEMLGGDGFPEFGFDTPGALFVAFDDDEQRRLDKFVETAAAEGWAARKGVGNIRVVGSDDLKELSPTLRTDIGAVHVDGMGRVDGRQLRAALRAAFVTRGGTFITGDAHVELGASEHVVTVGEERYGAANVVLASGSWPAVGGLESVLPEPLAVRPQRGQILHVDVPQQVGSWPIVNCFNADYFINFADHRVVFGATREDGVGHDWRVTLDGQKYLADRALALAPGLADATVVETRVGFRPLTTDGYPMIGALEGAAHVFVANGFGAGLTQSPLAGGLITSLVRGEDTVIDIAPYAPGRFASIAV
jgi:D-amino-acid dehydrogenase